MTTRREAACCGEGLPSGYAVAKTLSLRTANSLRAAGLNNPDQLRELLARNQPGKIPNIGKKSLNELHAWLEQHGQMRLLA